MIQEGITATKGFVHYWNRVDPAPGVDANRTVFHVIDAPPPATVSLTVPPGGEFVAWIYGEAMAFEVFGGVQVVWLWQDRDWVAYAPVLGSPDFAIPFGSTLYVVVQEETSLAVPLGP